MRSTARNVKIGYVLIDTCYYSLAASAIRRSLGEFLADDVLIYSDNYEVWPSGSRVRFINKISSKDDYNNIILNKLPHDVVSDYVMVLQYDGFVLSGARWRDEFLEYDYIGAPWPNFEFYRVGNGGFSLRSRRLINALFALSRFRMPNEAEDVFIGRTLRPLLESYYSIKFAPEDLALEFSFESPGHRKSAFGFHGVLNLPIVYPDADEFWRLAAGSDLLERRAEMSFGAMFLEGHRRASWLRSLER
jgi:hypothetical protein